MTYHFVMPLQEGIEVVYKLLLVFALKSNVMEIEGLKNVVGWR
jgi:hypothetical protein